MRRYLFHIFICTTSMMFASSCSVDGSNVSNSSNSKKAGKAIDDGINLNEYLVSSPKKRSHKEIVKLYMPGGKSSVKWQDYNKGADNAMVANDYPSAEVLLNKSIQLEPNIAKTYYMLGRSKYNSLDDRNDEAVQDLEKAVDLGESNPGVFETLASIYDTKGEETKAIIVLTRGIKICRKKRHLYNARGAIYRALGDKEKALQDYTSVLKTSPDFARVYIVRGQLYEELGENEKALSDYLNGAKYDSKDSAISSLDISLKFRATLLNKLGRHEEAIKDLTRVLSARPNDDEILRLRGEQYLALKDYRKAISDLTQSIESAPHFARLAFEARGKAYRAIGKNKLAEIDLSKASKMKESPAEKPMYDLTKER